MKIWVDILTPKQAWLLGTVTQYLIEEDIPTLITARNYAETCEILRIIGLEFTVVGKHGGGSLEGKLKASTQRVLELLDFINKQEVYPSCLVSHSSPSAVRTAFGLGIPVISSLDAPHATAVSRLTLPLSSWVVTPRCFDPERFIELGAQLHSIVQYDGIDEVAWISQLKPNLNVLNELDLSEDDVLVLFRPAETQASYLRGITTQPVRELPVIQGIHQKFPEIKIVAFPRYLEQKEILEETEGVIIPEKPIDAPSLMMKSSLVLSGGGTMIRESALLGIPSISMFPTYLIEVERFLMDKGLPLWYLPYIPEATQKSLEILEQPKKFKIDSNAILSTMVNPAQVLTRLVKGFY
jgi:predicted glycosyltransferase